MAPKRLGRYGGWLGIIRKIPAADWLRAIRLSADLSEETMGALRPSHKCISLTV